MSMPDLFQAQMRLQQGDYQEAEKSARRALEAEPENPQALEILAIALVQQERSHEAVRCATDLMAAAPGASRSHYIFSIVKSNTGRQREAEKAIKEAISLDPEVSDYHQFLAHIRSSRSDWEGAIEAADAALHLDPENTNARNIKARALVFLKRHEAADFELKGSLSTDPNNAYTHTNHGWVHLQRGDHKQAKECFLEALRLDPNNENARHGLVQSIKATNVLMRLLLKYVFALQRLPAGARWGLIIGLYLVVNIASRIPGGGLLVFAYLLLVLFTWCTDMFMNIILFFHPIGRHALAPRAKRCTFGAIAAVIFGIGLGVAGIMTGISTLITNGLGAFFLMLPISALYAAQFPKALLITRLEVIGFTLAVLTGVVASVLALPGAGSLASTTLLLLFLSTWVNSFVLSRE